MVVGNRRVWRDPATGDGKNGTRTSDSLPRPVFTGRWTQLTVYMTAFPSRGAAGQMIALINQHTNSPNKGSHFIGDRQAFKRTGHLLCLTRYD